MMKFTKLIIALSINLALVLTSCSDDGNGSKVGTERGKISLTANGISTIYNIATLESVISGDTTTIVIRAESADSIHEVIKIGFQNIIYFKIGKFNLNGGYIFDPDTTFNYAYLYFEKHSGGQIINGKIDILDYSAGDLLQAKITFEIPNSVDTASHIIFTGEINLDYDLLNPEKVANLPISPGSMVVDINDSSTTLKAVSAHIIGLGLNKYSINGTSGSKTIVIELSEFEPKINEEYFIGDTIDSIGSIRATFSTNNETTFWADSGKVKISKITSSTIQGYFDFKATMLKDKTKKKILKNGMFYAKIENQR
jgi:hypothetical protein